MIKEFEPKQKNFVKNILMILMRDLPREMLNFRSTLNDDIEKAQNVKYLAELLLIEKPSIASAVPNVCTTSLLFSYPGGFFCFRRKIFFKIKINKNLSA